MKKCLKFLGISNLQPSPIGHDSTAAILDDHCNLFAISEERLTKIKHSNDYPASAIQNCLRRHNIRLSEIDKVGVGFGIDEEKVSQKRIDEKFGSYRAHSNFNKTPIEKHNPIFFDHQYIHARTGYVLSGFDKALIICFDGGGIDNGIPNVGGLFIAEKGKITPIKYYPHGTSLGLTYGGLTASCGFEVNDGEGKTMTISAFGEKENSDIKKKSYERICNIFPKVNNMDLISNGEISYDSMKIHNRILYTFDDTRLSLLERLYSRNLIAWAAQKRIEDIIIEITLNFIESSGIKNIIFSGGVFMNMIMNMKIREKLGKNFNLFFNPICGDYGNAVGAVWEQYYQETGKSLSFPFMPLYLGNSYTNEEIQFSLSKFNFNTIKVNKVDTAIDLIEKGNVIGWFQGRSEFGPRGLGNRSILSLATDEKIKDTVNNKVKKREAWRPFCPTIIEEKSRDFLVDSCYAPYMILGFHMKDPEFTPAVCHIDGTCRPQTLRKEDNSDFYEVVKGVGGIILNTSFNLAGDPIVETPYDALLTLKNSEMDALIINDFLIQKV